MTRDEFITAWCREHNLSEEFFRCRFEAEPDPRKHQTATEFGHDGWVVYPQRHPHWKFRIPVTVLVQIASELAKSATAQDWHLTSPAGNKTAVQRRQRQDKWGGHDWIEFAWDED